MPSSLYNHYIYIHTLWPLPSEVSSVPLSHLSSYVYIYIVIHHLSQNHSLIEMMCEEGKHLGNLWESNSSGGFSNSEKLGQKKKPSYINNINSNSNSSSPTPTAALSSPAGQKKRIRKRVPTTAAAANGGGESEHEVHIWTERERIEEEDEDQVF